MTQRKKFERLIEFFKSLGDQTRLRILILLSVKELCVCELCDILDLSQPKVSRHLAKLRDQGLVTDIREGQWVFYHLNTDEQMSETIIRLIAANHAQYETIQNDLQALAVKEKGLTMCKRRDNN
jgi:ArsR family transcriptional regulator